MNKLIKIIYDGECPFCKDFVKLQDLKKKGYDLNLINARDKNNPLIIELKKNYNLDEGMIVIKDQEILYGDEAAAFVLGSYDGKKIRGKIYSAILKNSSFAKISYPILTFLRKLFLKLINKKLINED